MSVKILSAAAQLYKKTTFAVRQWPSKSLKVIGIVAIQQAKYDFLLVVRSNNDSIVHRFRDITSLTVYVTVCDLEKSFTFEKTASVSESKVVDMSYDEWHQHQRPWVSLKVIFAMWNLGKYAHINIIIAKRMWLIISTVFSKLKDF